MSEELLTIAKITKTRGLRGEVVADILTDFPDRFKSLESVVIVSPIGEKTSARLANFWFQKGRVILQFAEFDKIETAEKLRNCEVCIPENEAVQLEKDEFFDWQLEGCRVETLDGSMLGSVTEVMRTGAGEILVVKGDTKEYLIPFVEAICVSLEIEAKCIRIDPPEGLLEF